MKGLAAGWGRTTTGMLRTWWTHHKTPLLRAAVALMALAALVWLGYEFWRLLWQPGRMGAIDLRQRHAEVHGWFAGRPVYRELGHAVYPPASYVILWPLLGWLAVTPARWLWAATTVATLAWLIYLVVRESGAHTPLERAFAALIPPSMYATGAAIGNGQLIVHLLPALVAGLVLLHRGRRGWHQDLLAAALVMAALVKPTISAPFFWIVLFVPGRLRPALLVLLGYLLLTLFAASFQEVGLATLIDEWLQSGSGAAVGGSVEAPGYTNVHSWLGAAGLEEWNLPASLLVLGALGFWTHRHRHGDLWLLLGVAALIARFWTYHRWYDDLLILLPMVALFRIAMRGPATDGSDVLAGALLATTTVAMLAPGGLYLLPAPWNMLYVAGQITAWMIVLIFLLDRARRETTAQVG